MKYRKRWKKAVKCLNDSFKQLFSDSMPGRLVWPHKEYLYLRCIMCNFYKIT